MKKYGIVMVILAAAVTFLGAVDAGIFIGIIGCCAMFMREEDC